MSTITDMSRTSYEKISRLIFYHLFAPVVEIETNGENTHTDKSFTLTQKPRDCLFAPHEDRLNDTFNNATSTSRTPFPRLRLIPILSQNAERYSPEDNTIMNISKESSLCTAPRGCGIKTRSIINDFLPLLL